MKYKCDFCEKEFERKPAEYRGHQHHYCSVTCRQEGMRFFIKDYAATIPQRTTKLVKRYLSPGRPSPYFGLEYCLVCGKNARLVRGRCKRCYNHFLRCHFDEETEKASLLARDLRRTIRQKWSYYEMANKN